MSTAHEMFLNFDTNPSTNTHGVFLHIYKAFDRVWQDYLFKLESYCITDKLLSLNKHFVWSLSLASSELFLLGKSLHGKKY